jgi:FAD/FMN-containing dehydrogenase
MPYVTYSRGVELKKELSGTDSNVITPDDEEYAESIKRFSESCEREAGAVVRVSSPDEVSKVVKFATKHHIPIAVKGAAYSTSASSSTHGGIVIDLCKLSRVIVDPESHTVTAQGGATWEDVDRAAARFGLAVVGPTTNYTGVGGTALGGGYGWLTGRYGLVIDNLLSLKMVLADGRIVNASAEENPDLFWATRGAGQDFGVATELVFKAYPQSDGVFGGVLYFSLDKLPAIVDFVNGFEHHSTGNEGLFFGFDRPPLVEKTMILMILFYNGSETEALEFFQPLLSLTPTVNETEMMPYIRMNTLMNKAAKFGGRKRISGANFTLPLDIKLLEELYQDFDKIMKTYPHVNQSALIFELLPYNEVIKVPNNSTAFMNRGRYYNVASIFCWHAPEIDSKMKSLQQSMMQKIGERLGIARSPHVGDGTGLYANFVGHDAGAKDLFGDNLPRLQELKMKYDPTNVFRKWHDLFDHKNVG